MDKTNSKILLLSFALVGAIIGFTVHMLIKSLAGAFGIVAMMASSDMVTHGFPVALAFLIFAVLQFNPRILAWGDEVVVEIRKVVWPSQKDMSAMTVVVVIMVLISSVIVTSFDFVSGYLINILMK
jgi:preprotein translocase subunit SecE